MNNLSNLLEFLGLEPKTTAVLIGAFPIFLMLIKYSRRSLSKIDTYFIRAVTFHVTKALHLAVATRYSLIDYATRSLNSAATKFLYVPGNLDTAIPIDDCFVPLRMLDSSRDKSLDHNDLIRAGNRLCVIGDPGSGKSTVIKRIFRDECGRGVNSKMARMAIMINLRDVTVPAKLSTTAARSLLTRAISDKISSSSAFEIQRCYDICSKSSGVLVLLDGLDEVASKDYRHVYNAITHLSEVLAGASDNNVLLITMRTQFHRQVSREIFDIFPLCFEVKSFTPTDIYSFLTKWPFENSKRENVLRIYNRLNGLPTLREMCTNPLILSMYVAEDQNTGRAPHIESRTSFYRKVVDELLYRRRATQFGAARVPQKIREQRQNVLGRAAYEHLIDMGQPANHLSWKRLTCLTREEFKCSEADAVSLVWEMSRDTGLFTEEQRDESFRFIHLTFCEFLAALYCAEILVNGFLALIEHHTSLSKSRNAADRTRLSEVVPFCCGLLPIPIRETAVAAIIQNEPEDYRLQVLVFLETKLYDDVHWPSFRERIQSHLLATLSDKSEQWLHLFRIFAVVCTDAEQSSALLGRRAEETLLTSFFAHASGQGRDVVVRLVLDYVRYDGPAAVEMANLLGIDLASTGKEELISNCDQPALLAVVCKMAEDNPQDYVNWAAILAEAAVRSPAVAENLRSAYPISTIRAAVAKLPVRSLWCDPVCVKRDIVTECISIVMRKKESLAGYPMLSLVASLPNPRKQIIYFLIARWEKLGTMLSMSVLYLCGLLILAPFYSNWRGISSNMALFQTDIAVRFWSIIILLIPTISFNFAKPKARVIAAVYCSIIHERWGQFQLWMRNRILPAPKWIIERLPARLRYRAVTAYHGKTICEALSRIRGGRWDFFVFIPEVPAYAPEQWLPDSVADTLHAKQKHYDGEQV